MEPNQTRRWLGYPNIGTSELELELERNLILKIQNLHVLIGKDRYYQLGAKGRPRPFLGAIQGGVMISKWVSQSSKGSGLMDKLLTKLLGQLITDGRASRKREEKGVEKVKVEATLS